MKILRIPTDASSIEIYKSLSTGEKHEVSIRIKKLAIEDRIRTGSNIIEEKIKAGGKCMANKFTRSLSKCFQKK